MSTITGAAERLQRTLLEYNMTGAAVVVVPHDDWERFEWALRREIEPFMRTQPHTFSKMFEITVGKIKYRKGDNPRFKETT